MNPKKPARVLKMRIGGQALPIGLFFMFLGVAMLYFMFNSGQIIGEKVRVTNAADMAAYSVGVQQARVLNYDAYINRAIVANEIAIAQMLSLQSWLHYFDAAITSSGAVGGFVNTLICGTAATDCLKAQAYSLALAGTAWGDAFTGGQASETVMQATDWASVGIVSAHNIVAVALSASQQAVHLTMALGVAQWNLANDVVSSMDSRMTAQIVPTSYDFASFTKGYERNGSGGDERGRLADVIMRSRDPFTANRGFTFEGRDIPFVLRDVALKKRGGTDLIGFDQWKAMDTLEGHARHFGCGKFGTSWCGDIQQSMAAGGARAVREGGGGSGGGGGKWGNIGGSPREGYLGGSYAENSRTASWGDRTMVTVTDSGAVFTGLPTSRDLADLSANASGRTGITVLVMKSGDDVRATSGSAATKPTGQLDMFAAKPASNRMASLSRAEILFDRPVARADGRVERPSLYNPYWTVRLVAPTTGDKAYAALQQGGRLNPP